MPSAEQMLQDAAWLKRLATTLASDGDEAEDLVQESWIASWRRQPDASRPMRPWLAKVVRDLAGMQRRSDRRRVAREAIADDGEASAAAPDELLEQMRLHRFLVDLVLKLDEPYRSTVIARFVEGRTSASISHSLGIPAGTVRKRLREALTRLRAGLDTQAGDRKRWAPAVIAFAKGGIQVAKPAKLVLVVLAALLVVSVATVIGFVVRRSTGSTSSATPPATSNTAPSRVVLGRSATARVVVAVTDTAGAVANAIVRCAPPGGDVVTAQTARDGTATVELAPGEWSIAASAEGHEPSAVTLVVVAGRDARVAVVLGVGGRTVTGAVTDAGGGAIAGARVDAARIDANTNPTRAVAVAFTDRIGHYKISVGAGQILVAASHPEYAPQIRHVDLGPSGATANFALVPGSVIEGVVRDQETKQPVAGAEVFATHDSSALELAEANEHVAISGADGTFRVAGLRPGAYQLSARDGARSTRAPVRVGLGVAEQQGGVVVLIDRGAAIRGKVVDDTGAAVAAVTVHAPGETKETTATSNGAGEFVLEGLAPSRWVLWGTSDQYVPEGHTIVELKTSDVEGIVVHVRRGIEAKGHVEPREACDVALAENDGAADDDESFARTHTTTTTDARGEFRFGPLLPGKARLTARCPNGDQGKLDVVVAANAADSVIAIAPGSSIAGRVIDTAGNAIVGVTVNAERLGDDQMTLIANGAVTSGFKAITATDGSFEIRGLDAARYHLAVLDRGRPIKAKHSTKVELTSAQRATGIEMVVERPSGTISGTVSSPDGAPIPDAWVSLQQNGLDQIQATIDDDDRDAPHRFRGSFGGVSTDLPPALTDARGHFEMSSVPHGTYQVVAEAQAGQLRGTVAGVIPDREIAIQLVAVSSLHGTVHGAHGPSELFSVDGVGPPSSFTDGAFEFPRVDPGDYTIEVTSSDGTGSATVHVASGETGSADITLIANATVTGRLVDKSGKPIAGMSVAIIPDQPPGTFNIALTAPPPSSGPDGRFQVDGQPGKKTLVVLGSPPTVGKTGMPLVAGQTIDIGDVTVIEPK